MPVPEPTSTGEMEWDVPGAGRPCKTFYKIYGQLDSGQTPLLTLHGGPGAGHDYLLSLTDLHAQYSIPVIFYDQVGTGLSTHLPEKKGDESFWTPDLFLSELEKLLGHLGASSYNLLGQSWGGLLGSMHAVRQPKGLQKLIIANSPADMTLWSQVTAKLRKQLPEDVEATLKKHEDAGTTDSKEYGEAVMEFYKKFLCRVDPFPDEVMATLGWLESDPTVYNTMNGPSEFHVIGSLKSWAIGKDAQRIQVPTLLINGRYDEAQDESVVPFFKEIPKVRWYTFANGSHMPHWEEREKYMELVSQFLSW